MMYLRAKRLDPPDDLVPRHDRQLRFDQIAVDDMQVCSAHRASRYRHAHLVGSGCWRRDLRQR
jgi:hypothetical protein